ncbi:MAG: DoxX family protein [Anaerolineales bacterium]|nr:DoxX family membrane protein [Anaerolineae bacterium]PWB73903.1 MAG: DoxX family protein [Anaerolineales bacterium]
MSTYVLTRKGQTLETPSFINMLFSDKRFSILWLAVRVWLGWQWIDASLHKLQNPAWMQTGDALKGFWMGAVQIPAEGRPAIAYDWYRNFLQFMLDAQAYTWFAKIVAISEFLFGALLIAGIFVGLTAFFSGFMNWNFIMAGSASVNGVFFGLAVLLVLAWKIAGYIGLDYFLLPRVGDLWATNKK